MALVHFWFPLEPNCARFLQEVLKPGHVALTHLPIRLEGDAPGKIDQVRGFYKDIFLLFPGMPARVFRKQVSDEPKSTLAGDGKYLKRTTSAILLNRFLIPPRGNSSCILSGHEEMRVSAYCN